MHPRSSSRLTALLRLRVSPSTRSTRGSAALSARASTSAPCSAQTQGADIAPAGELRFASVDASPHADGFPPTGASSFAAQLSELMAADRVGAAVELCVQTMVAEGGVAVARVAAAFGAEAGATDSPLTMLAEGSLKAGRSSLAGAAASSLRAALQPTPQELDSLFRPISVDDASVRALLQCCIDGGLWAWGMQVTAVYCAYQCSAVGAERAVMVPPLQRLAEAMSACPTAASRTMGGSGRAAELRNRSDCETTPAISEGRVAATAAACEQSKLTRESRSTGAGNCDTGVHAQRVPRRAAVAPPERVPLSLLPTPAFSVLAHFMRACRAGAQQLHRGQGGKPGSAGPSPPPGLHLRLDAGIVRAVYADCGLRLSDGLGSAARSSRISSAAPSDSRGWAPDTALQLGGAAAASDRPPHMDDPFALQAVLPTAWQQRPHTRSRCMRVDCHGSPLLAADWLLRSLLHLHYAPFPSSVRQHTHEGYLASPPPLSSTSAVPESLGGARAAGGKHARHNSAAVLPVLLGHMKDGGAPAASAASSAGVPLSGSASVRSPSLSLSLPSHAALGSTSDGALLGPAALPTADLQSSDAAAAGCASSDAAAASAVPHPLAGRRAWVRGAGISTALLASLFERPLARRDGGGGRRGPAGSSAASRARSPTRSPSRGQLAVQRAAWAGVRWEVRQLLESLLSDLAFHGTAAGTGSTATPSVLPPGSVCLPLPAAAAANSRSVALAAAVLSSAPASVVGSCPSAAAAPALAALRIAADAFHASAPRARLGPGHVLALMRCYGQLGQPHLAVELFERGYWAHVMGAAAPEPAAHSASDAAGTGLDSGAGIEGAAGARDALAVLLAPAEATASLGLRTPHARRQGLPRLALAVGLSAMGSHARLLGMGRAEIGAVAAGATGAGSTPAHPSPSAAHLAPGIVVRAGAAGLPAPTVVSGPVAAPALPRRSLLGRLSDRLGCATRPEGAAAHSSSERGSPGTGQRAADNGREESAASELAPAARALHSALVEQALRAYTRCLQYQWLPSAHLSHHQQQVTPHRQHANDGSGGSYRVSLRQLRPTKRFDAGADDSVLLPSAAACDETALAALPGRASARVSALLRSLDVLGCPRSDNVTNATATFLLAAARHAATRAGAPDGGRGSSGVSALTAPGGVATAFSAAQAAAGEATRLAMLGASGGIGWTTLTVVQSVAQLAAGGQRVSVHTLTTALRSLLRGCAAAAAEQGPVGGADGWRRAGSAVAAEGWRPPRHLVGYGSVAGGREGASPLLARAWGSWEQSLLAAALPGMTAAPWMAVTGLSAAPALLPSSTSSPSTSAALPRHGATLLPGTTTNSVAAPPASRGHPGAAGGLSSAVSPASLLQLMRSVAHGLLATAGWVLLPQHEAAISWSFYLAAVAAIERRPSVDAQAAAGGRCSSRQRGHGDDSNPQPRPGWLLAVEHVQLPAERHASDGVAHEIAGVWLPPEVAAFAPGATAGLAAPGGHAGRSGHPSAPTSAAMPLDSLALVYAGRALAALGDTPSAASAVRCLLLHYGASLHGSSALLGRSHAAVQAQATAAGQPAVPLRLPPPPASARGATHASKRSSPAAEVWSQQKGPQQTGDGHARSAKLTTAAAVYLPDLRPATPLARLLCPLLELLQCQGGPEAAFDATQALLFTPDADNGVAAGSGGSTPARPVGFSRPHSAALAGLDAAGYIALMRLCATVTARGSRPEAVAAATHTHDALCAMQGLPTLHPQPRPHRIVINAAENRISAGVAAGAPAAASAGFGLQSFPSRPSLVWSEGTFAAAAGVLVAALPRGIAARQTRFASHDPASNGSVSQGQAQRAPHLLARDRACAAALPETAERLLRHMLEVSLAPGPHSGAALFAVLLAEGAVRGGERDAGVVAALSRSRYGGLPGARHGSWGSDDEGDAAPPPALEASRGAQLLLAASGVGRGLPLAESLSMVQRAASGRGTASGFSGPWRRGDGIEGSQLPLAAERIARGFGQAGACLSSLTDACSAPAARQLLLPQPEPSGEDAPAPQLAEGAVGAAPLSLDDAMQQATLAAELRAAHGSASGSAGTADGSHERASSLPGQERAASSQLRRAASTSKDEEAEAADGEEAEEEAAAALLSLGTALRWYHDSVKGLLAPLRLESRQHRGRVRRSLLPFVRPASEKSAAADAPVLGAISNATTHIEPRRPFALSAEQLRRSRPGSASRVRMQLR